MKIVFMKDNDNIKSPEKAHDTDSGFDIFSPETFMLGPGERRTVNSLVKFKLEFPWYLKILHLFGLGLRANIQPKSGMSKNGIEVSLGEIDESYTGYVGVTMYNTTKNMFSVAKDQKIAQITFTPIFNRLKLVNGFVENTKTRGEKGFGSSGLK